MIRGRFIILSYHRVLPEPDKLRPGLVTVDTFRMQMSVLARFFNVVDLESLPERIRTGRLLPRTVCVTFDDGYRDNFEIALPILQALQLPASFFIATGYLNGGIMWNDMIIESVASSTAEVVDLNRFDLGVHTIASSADKLCFVRKIIKELKYSPFHQRRSISEHIADATAGRIPRDIMMDESHVDDLRQSGMSIGGHTVNHPILSRTNRAIAEREIIGSKLRLEELLGAEVIMFAYPNGKPGKDYGKSHVEIVRRAGFELAVSTRSGFNDNSTPIWELNRVGRWESSRLKLLLRLVASYF